MSEQQSNLDHEARRILRKFGYDPDNPVPKDEFDHPIIPDKLLSNMAKLPIIPLDSGYWKLTQMYKTYKDGVEITEREKDCLQLAARGLTCPEIAKKLWLSTYTVRGHMKKSYAKLDAKNMTHAVVIAIRLGIIDAEE